MKIPNRLASKPLLGALLLALLVLPAAHGHGQDGPGHAGIAPAAPLLNLRVLDRYGHGSISSVAAAIDFAVANSASSGDSVARGMTRA
jgi:subtilisin family serine protease